MINILLLLWHCYTEWCFLQWFNILHYCFVFSRSQINYIIISVKQSFVISRSRENYPARDIKCMNAWPFRASVIFYPLLNLNFYPCFYFVRNLFMFKPGISLSGAKPDYYRQRDRSKVLFFFFFFKNAFQLVFHRLLLPPLVSVITHHILLPSNFLPPNWDFLSLNLLLCSIIILGFDAAVFWSWWPGSRVSPGTTSTVCNLKHPLCALSFCF